MALEQERGGAGDVRRCHARTVEGGERPAGDPERGGEDLAARRAQVRLEQVAEGGEPARGEAGDGAAAAGGELLGVAADPDACPAPASFQVGAQRSSVAVGDHAGRDLERDRDPVRLAGPVVDGDHADRAGGLDASRLQGEGADASRHERDRAGERAGGKRSRAAVEVARRAAEVARDRGAVDAQDRADVDECLIRRRPGGRGRFTGGPRQRDVRQRAGRTGRGHAQRGGEHVRVRERRDRDRVGRRSGRACRAEPVVVAVVAGRDDGHDARSGDVPHGLDERVARRIGLWAAAREVDHVHPVANRRLEGGDDLGRIADVPDRRGHVEDPVVADLRARRDAGEAGCLGVVAAARRGRAGVAGRDPGDVRAVERGLPVERQPAAVVGAGADERARDDHLGRRPRGAALREAGRDS